MEDVIAQLREKLQSAGVAVKSAADLNSLKGLFFGRKGEIARLTKSLKERSVEERKKLGAELNRFKKEAQEVLTRLKNSLGETGRGTRATLDITRPGKKISRGHLHPLTIVRRDVERIFLAMGFSVVEGPETETEWYNFDALNMPPDHPAREMQDTFWLKPESQKSKVKSQKSLLRTQTSPVQVRYMETHKPPLRIIVPGRVFRRDASDASHDIQFYQVEGLMVDKVVSIANFKAVMQAFFEQFFKRKMVMRLRPGYFPFTEPSFEIDLSCPKCGGKRCGVCKHSGWMELAGAGMVHQQVFKNAGYTPGVYMGFAFGMGLDRLTMVKYGIDDIRLFYGGDLRFLRQF